MNLKLPRCLVGRYLWNILYNEPLEKRRRRTECYPLLKFPLDFPRLRTVLTGCKLLELLCWSCVSSSCKYADCKILRGLLNVPNGKNVNQQAINRKRGKLPHCAHMPTYPHATLCPHAHMPTCPHAPTPSFNLLDCIILKCNGSLPMLNVWYFYISTLLSVAVFCSSLISCLLVTLLKYFLNDFEIVLFVPIITGVKTGSYIPYQLNSYCKAFTS
jgi:hypothetical protein